MCNTSRRWLEALRNYEAKKKHTRDITAYQRAGNSPQNNRPANSSEALECVTDTTDKNLDPSDTEMVDETLARHHAKAEGRMVTDESPNEMCRHDVRGGCWLCHKQGRFPSTNDGKGDAA